MITVQVSTPECMMCGRSAVLEVPLDGLRLWDAGVLVQDAFPELDQAQRELLMTGTHDHCWQAMWNLSGIDDEEDGDE
jgi:hypothetical protein